jgi:predicted metal-dependent HD superfamily phosphohydrolase
VNSGQDEQSLSDLESRLSDTLGRATELPLRARQGSAAAELLARWREPHRRYHTLTHLVAVLDALDLLLDGPEALPIEDRAAVYLAAWFHDAVYRGSPGDDEAASAALAEQVLARLGQPVARVAEVARLIRMTASHSPAPGDRSAEVLADADLSVLGSSDHDYRAYALAVRQEYDHVPEAGFRTGRAQVLRRLSAGTQIYRTPRGRLLWESAARANVAGEIARLEAGAADNDLVLVRRSARTPARPDSAADPRSSPGCGRLPGSPDR